MSGLVQTVEALLFVASEPVPVGDLAEAADVSEAAVERALSELAERYCEGVSGVVLERAAGGWGFRAARETAAACSRLLSRPIDRPLSQAALETLAIIAYTGPASRPEIARIRGVAADAAVASLLERGLIEESGRAERPGAPMLYRTTTAFARLFGLEEGQASLPPLEDLAPAGAGDPAALKDRLTAVAAQRDGAV